MRTTGKGRWLFAVALVGAGGIAVGQYRLPENGRLFDANPQVGGTGYNMAQPIPPLWGGNAMAEGLVGRGLSLRTSTVGNPNYFTGGLGTQSLSAFQRDSVSVADAYGTRNPLLPQIYYDPGLTVPTAGLLRGVYQSGVWNPTAANPGWNSARQPGTGGIQPLDHRVDNTSLLWRNIAGTAPGVAREATSSIFGVAPVAPPVDADAWMNRNQAMTQLPPTGVLAQPEVTPFGYAGPERWRPGMDPLDALRPGEAAEPVENENRLDLSLNYLLEGDSLQVLTDGGAALDMRLNPGQMLQPADPGQQGRSVIAQALAERQRAGAARSAPGRVPVLSDVSMLPGNDVYTDLRLAMTLRENPATQWYDEMTSAVRSSPFATPEMQAQADTTQDEFVARVLAEPLRSFVGRGANELNRRMMAAEGDLDAGQYYSAAREYERAELSDPANPLPRIGRGHALLAAGDYLSAAVSLLDGLQRFPELAQLDMDLTAMLGGGEIVDVRRADIMRRLEQVDDPRLRFLLGYLEYYTGQQERGLENLRRAAQSAGPGTTIWRFVQRVSARSAATTDGAPASAPAGGEGQP